MASGQHCGEGNLFWPRHRRATRVAADPVALGSGYLLFFVYSSALGMAAVVLASHRVNPSRVNRDWGTISYKEGILAQCPVLLVK